MSFLKDDNGIALTVYRGECTSPDRDFPHAKTRAIYFGDREIANRYATPNKHNGLFDTPRIYPANLWIGKLFLNQPNNPMLELNMLVSRLGYPEARRIAERFSGSIEETDQWRYRINQDGKFSSVREYLRDPMGSLCQLYFQAFHFFESDAEVSRLQRLGYGGAIHGGNGYGSEGKAEYCVFSKKQIHLILDPFRVNENVEEKRR